MWCGISCKPHNLVIFFSCKNEKAGFNGKLMWPCLCDGTLLQILSKKILFHGPHRAQLLFESRFVLLTISRLPGMWAASYEQVIFFLHVVTIKILRYLFKIKHKKMLGKERTIKASAPGYTL